MANEVAACGQVSFLELVVRATLSVGVFSDLPSFTEVDEDFDGEV
jgi:hypothetical protein